MSVLRVRGMRGDPFRGRHVAAREKPAQTFLLPLPVAAAICSVSVIAAPTPSLYPSPTVSHFFFFCSCPMVLNFLAAQCQKSNLISK